jgi:photosystem II stability/assembly factor-like uncharacterized protein
MPEARPPLSTRMRAQRLLAGGAVLLLAFGARAARADDATCTNPKARPLSAKPAARQTEDDPADRAGWFVQGRRQSGPGLSAAGGVPPARRLLQSFQQFAQLPRRPGLAAASPWQSLGPAPQASLYWGNVSGRVTSLAVDGRGQGHALYLGTALGGLWKTDDFTAARPHFVPLSDAAWPSLAVGSVALDLHGSPWQPPVLYVGTGEANDSLDSYYGVGILKSADGGHSWSISTGAGGLAPLTPGANLNFDGPFVGAAIARIVVDLADPQHVLAAASSSYLSIGKAPKTAIYQSHDGGQSWHPTSLGDGASAIATYDCTDLVYEPVQKAFFAAVSGRGVYRLATGQANWQPTASPFGATRPDGQNFARASLATRPGDPAGTVYVVVSAGNLGRNDARTFNLSKPGSADTGIAASKDQGATWQPVPAPVELFGGQGFYDQWVAAPAGGVSLLAGGIDVWRAPNVASPAWKNLTQAYDWADDLAHVNLHIHPDQHAIVALDERRWIVGNDGGVWRTDDSGATWTDLNTDINSIQFTSATPLRGTAAGYLGGSQDNGTALVAAAGQPWITTLGGDGGFTAGNRENPHQYFTERYNVSLCRSDDSGRTWQTVVDATTIAEPSAFYVPYEVLAATKEVVLGTQRIWLGPATNTTGAQWRAISDVLGPDGVISAVASAAGATKTVVYAATTDGQAYRNGDIHATDVLAGWIPIKHNLPNDRVYAAIAVDPSSENVAYVAVQGFGTGHLYRTDNAGSAWRDVTPAIAGDGGPEQIDTPVNAILIDPAFPSEVYIATDIGVMVSTDRGTKWSPHGVGLPTTAVMDLKMTDDRRILAATHGRGAWIVDAIAH